MKNQNATALILLLFFTFNSYCQSIILEEVLGKGKVKVVTTFGKTFKFEKIELKNSIYYGVNGNELVRIYTEDISEIQILDKTPLNKIFVTTGLVEFDEEGNYATFLINYERRLHKWLSGRFSYGTSFQSYGLLSKNSVISSNLDPIYDDFPSKQTFYSVSACYTTYFRSYENNSQLEVNVGYALIIKEPYSSSKYSYSKRETINNPVLGIGYRLTKGSFVFRTGVGWPYGRYLSLGYAF